MCLTVTRAREGVRWSVCTRQVDLECALLRVRAAKAGAVLCGKLFVLASHQARAADCVAMADFRVVRHMPA